MGKKEKEGQKQEVFAKLSEEKQRGLRFQKLELSNPVISKQLEKGQKQIHELTLKIKSALMEQQHLKKEIENLHGCMQYRSLQEAKKETTQKQLAIQKFNRESEYAKRQVELSNQELNTLMGKIDSLKEQVAATQTESYEGLHVRLEELLNSKAIVEEKYLQINERYVRNQEASNNIRKYSEQLKKLETRYQWVRSLSNTANGDLNGKERIKLETFIQMNYFDRIINHANVRFMVMSNGQYELKRKMESSNKGKQSGLDLDVIDHYNGSIRSVKTLSGGESFMASLSLALGLSDEVQRSAGGIQLNTMFVDEGFGALDEETLNLAIRTLTNLSEQNRLIGIISHVAELKEKIDHQIVVKKDKYSGSKVEIIV